MKVATRLKQALLTGVAAAAAVYVAPASACGLHGVMVDLAAAHPRSIEVALAVREASDSDALRSLPALPPSLGLLRAQWLLKGFAPHVSALAGATQGTVAVLLVESGLWARYAVAGAPTLVEAHISGPLPGERLIVTSEAVLSALADGTLSADRAAALGVVVVVGDTAGGA